MPEIDNELIPIPAAEEAESPETEGDEIIHFKWRVAKDLTRRIDQYLVDRVGYLSRNSIQHLIKEGLVKVNGKTTKPSYHPCNGDIVEMAAPPEPVNELTPEPIPLDIVYEDEYFLALNKQRDLIVHPARGRWSGTLVNGLVHYGQKWSTVNGNWRPGILHRLDRNTTGIMLVAKADEAHWRLARQFENRTIQKTYIAIVHGVPELQADEINMPIGQDRRVREKQAVRKVEHGGKPAITRYEVQESFTAPPGLTFDLGEHANDQNAPPVNMGKFSLVKLWPKTGRTHQLRVHMAAKGHPMVGDTMYGGRILSGNEDGNPFRFDRQALHAFEIAFTHPVSLNQMTLAAPLPPDFQQLQRIFRRGSQQSDDPALSLKSRSERYHTMQHTLAFFSMPGGWEWLFLAGLGLLLFGKRLPEVGRSLGASIVEFKKGLKGVEDDAEAASNPKKLDSPKVE